jgi:glycosyltransferase involved in cell wall biosynthesis
MKILYVTLQSSVMGKANIDILNPAIELARRGHQVAVVANSDSEGTPRDSQPFNVTIYRIGPASAAKALIYSPVFIARLLSVVSKFKPDIIVTENDLLCPLIAWIVAKRVRLPYLVQLRELTAANFFFDPTSNILRRTLGGLIMWFEKLLLLRTKHLLAINNGIAEYYSNLLHRPVPSIWLISFPLAANEVGTECLDRIRERYEISPDKFTFLYSGALSRTRNLEAFLNALHRVSPQNAFQLLITGVGKDKDYLQQKAQSILGADNVRFIAWLSSDELDKIMEVVDCGLELYIRPWPQSQTPSTKVAHYVARGLSFIAYAAPGYEEIVQDGVNGYLFKTEDQLQELLSKCLYEPDFRTYIRSREWKHSRSSMVDIVPAVDELERKLLSVLEEHLVRHGKASV